MWLLWLLWLLFSPCVFCFSANTLTETLSFHLTEKKELQRLVLGVASACAEIAGHLSTLPLTPHDGGGNVNVQGEIQGGMDVLANRIFLDRVGPLAAMLASEEEPHAVPGNNNMEYEIAFDPLDGSSNLDTSIPTGSIFGIYPHTPDKPFSSSGRKLVAAGYAVYSSCTEFVLSLGDGNTMGFVLMSDGVFLLARNPIRCPESGPYYSLNEAREPDWPDGLRRWVHNAKQRGSYSSRYVCSLCADLHRTLIRGGWAGNPRPHLRLLYEAAPLAFVTEAAGGKGIDGASRNLLDIVPVGLHDRVSVFLGSIRDVEALESYGNIQQQPKTYKQ